MWRLRKDPLKYSDYMLFFPALSAGSLFGSPVTGLVAPAGVSVVFGAFIFGIGMQLGGGCILG